MELNGFHFLLFEWAWSHPAPNPNLTTNTVLKRHTSPCPITKTIYVVTSAAVFQMLVRQQHHGSADPSSVSCNKADLEISCKIKT